MQLAHDTLCHAPGSLRAGFVHLYSGQEAISTGIIRQLRKSDYICSTYRDHVHALSKVHTIFGYAFNTQPVACQSACMQRTCNHVCRSRRMLVARACHIAHPAAAWQPWIMAERHRQLLARYTNLRSEPSPWIQGVPAKNIMAELFGKKTGICRGQGGSMHMFSAEWGLVR